MHQKAGRGCWGWGVEPLLEFSRSLHHLVLVGRCPEQLDSGLASTRQHVLAPGAARPHQNRMLAANQSSDFQPPPSPPFQNTPHHIIPSKSQTGSQAWLGNPGLEVRTGHVHVHVHELR